MLRNLLLALVPAACTAPVTERAPLTLTIAALNDFHGNLEMPAGGVLMEDAANVLAHDSVKPLIPANAIRAYAGVKVAFIGLTLKEAPAALLRASAARW